MTQGRIGIVAAIATLVVFLLLYWLAGSQSETAPSAPSTVAQSTFASDKCVSCHHRQTPTIVEQWANSTHAKKQVTCSNCHEVSQKHPTAKEHFGTFVTTEVTPTLCASCHAREAKQFALSRHSVPAWTALVGYKALDPHFQAQFDQITEIRHAPGGGELPTGLVGATRNALYDLEGSAVTKLACESCHQVGRPNADGSAGNCNACHLRHDFSLSQSRKPETCNRCHIGPDHPQFEIYTESSHGILYATQGHHWNWDQKSGRLGVKDMPAATCQICHMSGFGGQGTTHDVGDRLSWYLFAEISEHRPNWEENRQRMKSVCNECHSPPFVNNEYDVADKFTEAVNEKVGKAKSILERLVSTGRITDKPFDDPIKFAAFELWHHYGRTAKFGAWMQGPDYAQWHGIYPMMSKLAELEQFASHHSVAGAMPTSAPAQ